MEQSTQIYLKLRKSEHFLKIILKFIRPSPSSKYNCFNTKCNKHLTRLCLGLSNVCNHRFKHGFLDSLNPICSCGLDNEANRHFLLLCPNLINERSLLLNNVSSCLLVTLQLSNFSFMVMIHWIQ